MSSIGQILDNYERYERIIKKLEEKIAEQFKIIIDLEKSLEDARESCKNYEEVLEKHGLDDD